MHPADIVLARSYRSSLLLSDILRLPSMRVGTDVIVERKRGMLIGGGKGGDAQLLELASNAGEACVWGGSSDLCP